MDIDKISQTYSQFHDTAQQAFQLLEDVMTKMQTAADNGDTQAGEWVGELQKVAETFQGGQTHASDLLQQFHGVMSTIGQKSEGDAKEGNNNGLSNLVSNFLQSDIGKSLEAGAMEKIGSGFLSKFFK